jgi:hypothetical protein
MPNTIVVRPPYRKYGYWPLFPSSLVLATVTGAGGVRVGGSATMAFVHAGQVESDIVVEWDLDNDGDFDQAIEDITSYVLSLETSTGRDWPSQLTGKAGPGQLRMTLRNDDDRFSYFNTASPLATSPFSLRTGRKLRVRTSSATSPDPTPLARDRFRRANGALGTSETGLVWSDPLANDFTISSMEAVATSAGNAHLAVVDVSSAAYYAQVTISETGSGGSVIGLTYRYQDTTNYSLAVIDVTAAQIQLIDVVAGTPTTIANETVESYDGMTIGVLVSGTSVTFYHEGVSVFSGTAIQTDETEVGIYASRGASDSFNPAISSFHVWTALPAEVEGILWTGDVSDLMNTVAAGPQKLATVSGQGWLSRLSGQQVDPISTLAGKKTGVLVGEVLATTNLLQPPGFIDEGDITTGPFGTDETEALELCRRFEDTEYGFLYESQEGYLSFASRTARAAETSAVTFSDVDGGSYGYHAIETMDWRREVFNRVIAGIAPSVPTFVSVTTTSDTTLGAVSFPATVTAGDLLLVFISISADTEIQTFYIPDGWVELKNDSPTFTSKRVLAKVAIGNEDGTTLKFAEVALGTPCVDTDTEIFTRRGWLRHDQVNATDETRAVDPLTGDVVWTRVVQVRRFTGHHEVFRFTGAVNAVTTMSHQWLVRRDDAWVLTSTLKLRFDDEVRAENGLVTIRDLRFEQDVIDGVVWCPTTEVGNWLARRDGTMFFTGNKP